MRITYEIVTVTGVHVLYVTTVKKGEGFVNVGRARFQTLNVRNSAIFRRISENVLRQAALYIHELN